MTNSEKPTRETYEDYLAGRATFDDVKRATDRAAQEYERSRGGRPGDARAGQVAARRADDS